MPETKYRKENLSDTFPFKAYVMGGAKSFLYHWHEYIEILFCINDCFKVGIEDEIYTVEEGQSVIINSGEKHCIFSSDDTKKRIVVQFHPDLVNLRGLTGEDMNTLKSIKPHSVDWHERTRDKVRACICALLEESTNKEAGWIESAYSELFKLKSIYIREIPKRKKNVKVPTYNPTMKRILEYLGENFSRGVTLNDCATDLGYNRSYLSTLIKKNTGSSFHKYLTSIRLNEAKQLLMNFSLNISEVAEQAGFSNSKTFHRVFHNRYSMSPGAYRKKYSSEFMDSLEQL